MKKSQQRRSSITKNILYLAGEKTHGRTTSFAKLVGISVKQAHDILEKGVIPKLDTLIKITEAFGIQLDDLITDKPTRKEIDSNLVEIIVLHNKGFGYCSDPLFRRNWKEGIKLHIEMYEKGLEHELTGIIDTLGAFCKRIIDENEKQKKPT
jgi:transcriptional regulator with XRE-family HTH domain